MLKKRIFVLDDMPDTVRIVSDLLTDGGYLVDSDSSPLSGLKKIQKNPPDLLILDIRMDEMDGLKVCKKIKSDSKTRSVAIIMLSIKAQETDVVVGLELGADDYISKPIREAELLARVKAVLRRKEVEPESEVINVGPLHLDRSTFTAKVGEEKLDLTLKEFELLAYLAQREGRVITRNTLSQNIWGREHMPSSHTIDHHVYELRKKLGPYGKWIEGLKGIGYRFEVEEAPPQNDNP